MDYCFSMVLNNSYDEAVRITTEAHKSEGFGVISEINMHEKLKEKAGVDFKRYKILGACNPPYAYKALQTEDKIEITAVKPIASMQAITNQNSGEIALEITGQLKKVISSL
jgi:uncharacterized protein (DUF302 family)